MLTEVDKLLLTGATGFVGNALAKKLMIDESYSLRVAVRNPTIFSENVEVCRVSELSASTNWTEALKGIDIVIHSAARVHVMSEAAADPLSEFRRVNVDGTLQLARQAVTAGVKRFIFISSIKVNGESTALAKPFKADDLPQPSDPYGVSKYEAELALRKLSEETGIEVVIIRPVLVYGPKVKANFLSMLRWVERGVPLPLGAIDNKRSLIYLDNLVDLILTCIKHPAAANQTFLASDGKDLSTTELLQQVAAALGSKARLLPIPQAFLETVAKLLGREEVSRRLCSSLQVDITKNEQLLNWTPPVSVEQAMQATAKAYIQQLP